MNVPRDVSVVGFDDISMAAHFNPPLSTMRLDLSRRAATVFVANSHL
jgi:DNA-binding LacI/PurR family transcriptional regulator